MVEKPKAPKRGKKNPIGDRAPLYVKLERRVIDEIQQAALEERRAAWLIVQEAAEAWLARRKASRRT